MTENKPGTERKPEQPTELSDQEVEQAAGGRAAAKPPTIYDQPGSKLE